MTVKTRLLGALFGLAVLAACSSDPVVLPEQNTSSVLPSFARAAVDNDEVVAGEVVMKLRDGADVDAVARKHGAGVRGKAKAFNSLSVADGAERTAAAELGQDPDVVWAEPNYLRHTTTINSKLWAFYNPGGLAMRFSGRQYGTGPLPPQYASIADADEDNIEGYAAGGSDVVIGSIDTGVDFTHSEFTGRLIAGRDWVNNDDNSADDDGHGTHTTGTMAGSTVGVAGVSGAAVHVRVLVQKVCGKRGCPSAAIASAIRAAADYPNLVAMNLSLGGGSESQAEKDAIAYATGKGVLVIASAGNGNTGTVECPACDVNSISVGATNWRDALTYYTNWGSGLDIVAPGGECYSNTTPEGCIYSAYRGGGYEWLQGTSMAAPQVTGTAAIVASVTGLRGAALRAQILGSADDLGAAGYDTIFGNGRLNSYRAVTGGALGVGLAKAR